MGKLVSSGGFGLLFQARNPGLDLGPRVRNPADPERNPACSLSEKYLYTYLYLYLYFVFAFVFVRRRIQLIVLPLPGVGRLLALLV